MKKESVVNEIKTDLDSLQQARRSRETTPLVQRLVRNLNRASISDEKRKLLQKYAVDLQALLHSESEFAKLNKKGDELSEGYFRSLNILAGEIRKALV